MTFKAQNMWCNLMGSYKKQRQNSYTSGVRGDAKEVIAKQEMKWLINSTQLGALPVKVTAYLLDIALWKCSLGGLGHQKEMSWT